MMFKNMYSGADPGILKFGRCLWQREFLIQNQNKKEMGVLNFAQNRSALPQNGSLIILIGVTGI